MNLEHLIVPESKKVLKKKKKKRTPIRSMSKAHGSQLKEITMAKVVTI